jgi:hypothetical protein
MSRRRRRLRRADLDGVDGDTPAATITLTAGVDLDTVWKATPTSTQTPSGVPKTNPATPSTPQK